MLQMQQMTGGHQSQPTMHMMTPKFGSRVNSPRKSVSVEVYPNLVNEMVHCLHSDIVVRDENLPLNDLQVNLYPHQKVGVTFMLEQENKENFRGGILADDVC
jgi:hypothetical protein